MISQKSDGFGNSYEYNMIIGVFVLPYNPCGERGLLRNGSGKHNC